MTCVRCQHQTCKRFGYFGKRRVQRWRCTSCSATFADPAAPAYIRPAHSTDPIRVAQAIALMLEGMSIRAISRFTGLHKQTILSLMNTAAQKAKALLDAKVQNINPRFVQLDEMWGFVHTRDPHLHDSDPDEWGSTMLWLAIDSETKLLISHHVGTRSGVNAHAFVSDPPSPDKELSPTYADASPLSIFRSPFPEAWQHAHQPNTEIPGKIRMTKNLKVKIRTTKDLRDDDLLLS
jgi:transposase-like protein